MKLTYDQFVGMVDHTLLKPEATRAAVDKLCEEARDLGTASVCVNSYWVATVSEKLQGSSVLTCSVIGFPLGAMHPEALVVEARTAIAEGADEIDMVLPVGLVHGGQWKAAREVISAVRDATAGTTLKVILEVALLSRGQIHEASRMCLELGADFIKTSTGFNSAGGATVEAVLVMRNAVGDSCGIKASGGIRTAADVEAMVEAGATRLGLSGTVGIAEELRAG